jgi:hypothetical protein
VTACRDAYAPVFEKAPAVATQPEPHTRSQMCRPSRRNRWKKQITLALSHLPNKHKNTACPRIGRVQ